MSDLLVITEDDIVDGWYKYHDLTHDGSVEVRCDLDVRGHCDTSGYLYVRGHCDVRDNLYVSDYLYVGGYLYVRDNLLYVGDHLYVGGYLYVGGHLYVRGDASYGRRVPHGWQVDGTEVDRNLETLRRWVASPTRAAKMVVSGTL